MARLRAVRARKAGATLGLEHLPGVIYSARYYAGGDSAGALSLPRCSNNGTLPPDMSRFFPSGWRFFPDSQEPFPGQKFFPKNER